MNILYFWISVAIVFLIIEVATSTFYGLSLALSGAVVAIYTYFFHETQLSIMQALIFTLGSIVFALVLPRVLQSPKPDKPQGLDQYIGQVRGVRKAGDDLKISLDGVEYLIESDDEIKPSEKVEIIGHKGASLRVVRK